MQSSHRISVILHLDCVCADADDAHETAGRGIAIACMNDTLFTADNEAATGTAMAADDASSRSDPPLAMLLFLEMARAGQFGGSRDDVLSR